MPHPEELQEKLEEYFPVRVLGITPVNRGTYRVNTDKGCRCLSRVQLKPSRMIFIFEALKTIQKREQQLVVTMYQTLEKWPYFIADHSYWILTDWVNGRPINVKNQQELALVSRKLAHLHRFFTGIETGPGGKGGSNWTKWQDKMVKEQEIFDFYTQKVLRAKKRTDFDRMILERYETIKQRVQKAIHSILAPECQALMREEKNLLTVTYHRMREDDLLIGLAGDVHFINPFHLEYGLRVQDLGLWIERMAKKITRPRNQMINIIRWYHEERPLSRGEKEWLLSYLGYPTRVMRMIKRYYYNKKAWTEEGYVRKLERSFATFEFETEIYDTVNKYLNELGESDA